MDWLRLFSLIFVFTLLMLVLFLIVVTPIQWDGPVFVDVPAARWASKSPEELNDLTISIRANGTIYLANEELHAGALESRLSRAEAGAKIRLRVDRAAAFHHVRRAVLAARNAGFGRVTFMVRGEPAAVTAGEGFSLVGTVPENPNPWPAATVAAVCVAGAVMIRFLRGTESAKLGCAGWLLLFIAALALAVVWDMYFSWRPPGMWY